MEDKEEVVNINIFKKIWYSITNFEKYPEMATEGFNRAIVYLCLICIFLTIFMTIGSVKNMREIVNKLANYISENIPDFTYEDNKIQMDIQEPIIIENVEYDGIDRIIINPLLEDDTEKSTYQDENDKEGTTIYFFKNQIIVRIKSQSGEVNTSPYTYDDFIKSYSNNEITSFNKSQLIEFMNGNGMYNFYLNYALTAFLTVFITNVFSILMYALLVAAFGWLTTVILRLKIRFVAIFNMAIYSLTLSNILYCVYITINLFTSFAINYFEVAYITIAYIYLMTVIFLLKDDLVKRLQEVEKIKKEQEKVREEIQEEDKKREEEKDKNSEDKSKKEKKDKKKTDDKEEPSGSAEA